jgi:hypothetical protein
MTPYTYETRFITIVSDAWDIWTNYGSGLDQDEVEETQKSVTDAAANTYVDGIIDSDWIHNTVARLTGNY